MPLKPIIKYETLGVRVIQSQLPVYGGGDYIDAGFFPYANYGGSKALAEQAAIYKIIVGGGTAPTPQFGAVIPPNINASDGSGNLGNNNVVTSKSSP